jgi:hypothetical protein
MRRNFQIAIGLLWILPVIIFLQYRMVWDRLPQSVATHFGANGQPNGWMSRTAAMEFPLIPALLVVLVGAICLARIREPHAGSWAILGIFYVTPLTLIAINQQIIAFNLGESPIHGLSIVLTAFAGIVACLVVFLNAKRGVALPPADVVAEEVHGSRGWALIFLAMLAGFAMLSVRIPDAVARTVLGTTGVIFLPLAAATWLGFHYRFTHAGLEIRTLGVRLRSIPKEDIRDYREESWNWMGGYGIRGIGDDRAYVWGNSGVRIHTFGGSVFLGHHEPQRLIRDLDALTGAAT